MNFYFTSFIDTRLLACQMLKQFGHFLLRQETVIVLVKILYSFNKFSYSWNQIYQKVSVLKLIPIDLECFLSSAG